MEDKQSKEQFYHEMKAFLLSRQIDGYGDIYWMGVVEGTTILFKYREGGMMKTEMKIVYENLRKELAALPLGNVRHDFSDEFSALLIGYYNHMGLDFWKDDLRTFKSHNLFKRYFEQLEKGSSD